MMMLRWWHPIAFIGALWLRALLLTSDHPVATSLADRVELVTPVTSFQRRTYLSLSTYLPTIDAIQPIDSMHRIPISLQYKSVSSGIDEVHQRIMVRCAIKRHCSCRSSTTSSISRSSSRASSSPSTPSSHGCWLDVSHCISSPTKP